MHAQNAIVHDGPLDPGVELITKPFTQAALAGKLRSIIDSARVPGRILLVEDEVLIQMLATEFLERAGFTVETAGSATEAMNKLALVPGGVDAVIVDIGLPDRLGDVLVREIRASHSSLPIVVVTGQSATDPRGAFEGDRKLAFVAKRYSEAVLLAALPTLGIGSSSVVVGKIGA
jgi:CheY-like chemotaxis protein